jgi:chemotaxis methyl-accepting protein methylase
MEADGYGDFERIRLLVRRRRGVDLRHYRRGYVQRRILARIRSRRTEGIAGYAALLASDPEEVGKLVAALSTKVTSFFRNPGLYTALERRIVPDLLEAPKGRVLRFWSAGCATGQETWSVAAIAALHQPPPPEGRIRVLGTDVDRQAIAFAKRGSYPVSELRAVPAAMQRRFFTRVPGTGSVRVVDELAAFVRFREECLQSPAAAGAYDLILCRNVLIYFDASLQQRVLQSLARALRPGGFLALGRVERVSGPAKAAFEAVNLRERIYRRI